MIRYQQSYSSKQFSCNQCRKKEAADSTSGAETSRDVRFERSYVGQTQSPFIEVLIGEEVSQADVGGFLCDISTELLQGEFQSPGSKQSSASAAT